MICEEDRVRASSDVTWVDLTKSDLAPKVSPLGRFGYLGSTFRQSHGGMDLLGEWLRILLSAAG